MASHKEGYKSPGIDRASTGLPALVLRAAHAFPPELAPLESRDI